MDSTTIAETIVNQGKNSITSMQDLKRRTNKKGKERADLYERFRANEHSFRVYTYIDSNIEQSEEVQTFLINLDRFGANFSDVDKDFEVTVDMKSVEKAYQDVITAYNQMVGTLGFADEAI